MSVTPAVIVTGGGPNNELPGVPPSIDNTLPRPPGPVDPGFGIPLPPVTIWPTPRPPHIDNSLPIPPYTIGYPLPPTYPIPPPVIDNSPPTPPTMWPTPPLPPTVWPPLQPSRPDVPIYPLPPDNSLPAPPGVVWPPLPGVNGPVFVLIWVPGYGYRWTVIDPSLSIGWELPGGPPGGIATNPIQPTPEPRRG